jgi:predicted AAA+ superfamily ATPase
MEAAFGWGVDQYIYFGGYPGAAPLIGEPERWTAYIRDSLIETTVARDILQMSRVDKPALLRRLFDLGCAHSGQILSYQKMVGQLQDAGNTTTLAHYLDLLSSAGMLGKLEKYAGEKVRTRASSPKLQVLNTGLMSVNAGLGFEEAREDHAFWVRLVESCVGAHLVNSSLGGGAEVTYWRTRNREVDFILEKGARRVAIEVGTGAGKQVLPGFDAFEAEFGQSKRLLVGRDGVPVDEFLRVPAERWLS